MTGISCSLKMATSKWYDKYNNKWHVYFSRPSHFMNNNNYYYFVLFLVEAFCIVWRVTKVKYEIHLLEGIGCTAAWPPVAMCSSLCSCICSFLLLSLLPFLVVYGLSSWRSVPVDCIIKVFERQICCLEAKGLFIKLIKFILQSLSCSSVYRTASPPLPVPPQHMVDPHEDVEASLDLNIHNPLSLEEDVI